MEKTIGELESEAAGLELLAAVNFTYADAIKETFIRTGGRSNLNMGLVYTARGNQKMAQAKILREQALDLAS